MQFKVGDRVELADSTLANYPESWTVEMKRVSRGTLMYWNGSFGWVELGPFDVPDYPFPVYKRIIVQVEDLKPIFEWKREVR